MHALPAGCIRALVAARLRAEGEKLCRAWNLVQELVFTTPLATACSAAARGLGESAGSQPAGRPCHDPLRRREWRRKQGQLCIPAFVTAESLRHGSCGIVFNCLAQPVLGAGWAAGKAGCAVIEIKPAACVVQTAALAKHGLWHPELWDPAVLERTGLDGLVASLSGQQCTDDCFAE